MGFFDSFYGYHYTRIDDKKLGYLYNFLLIVIVFYVIFYSIIYNKGWLVKEGLIGTMTFDVHRNKKTQTISRASPYCKNGKCKILNEYDVLYPKYEKSFAITTALKDRIFNDTCTEESCTSTFGKGKNFYVADVENFAIKIEHSIQAKDFHNDHSHSKYIKHHKEMVGFLLDQNKNVLKRFEKDDSDYLSVDLILKAANVSLDEFSDIVDENDKTLRDRGSILLINVEYHNINGTDEFHYHYRVKRIPKTQYKTETLIRDGEQQIARTRYGLLLRFRQSGWAEVTDIAHILTVFGSSVGLISLASTVVYFVACYIYGYSDYFESVVDGKNEKEKQKQTKPKLKKN